VKYIALALLMLAVSAQGATNLAVTCTGVPSGNTCRPHVYAVPSSTTWVLSDGAFKRFGSLAPTDPVQVATNDVAPGSISDPGNGMPGTNWIDLPAAQLVPGKNTLELNWPTPTTSCEPGVMTPPIGYRLKWGTVNSLANIVNVGLVNRYTLTGLPAGSISVSIESLSADGKTCGVTEPTSWLTKAPLEPPAPVGLAVRGPDLTVYDLVKATNKLTLTAVGTVPAGTACTASAAAPVGYAVVDRSRVALLPGKNRPLVVVARCS
jgi:hypothetical protein